MLNTRASARRMVPVRRSPVQRTQTPCILGILLPYIIVRHPSTSSSLYRAHNSRLSRPLPPPRRRTTMTTTTTVRLSQPARRALPDNVWNVTGGGVVGEYLNETASRVCVCRFWRVKAVCEKHVAVFVCLSLAAFCGEAFFHSLHLHLLFSSVGERLG